LALQEPPHLQGSEKLYGAATQAIIAAMQQAVTALSREYDDPLLIGGYSAANRFHENFFHDHLEDYEIESERPAVHHFVSRVLALLDNE
jgi:hypothetical protein